jgi:hypothetical protein
VLAPNRDPKITASDAKKSISPTAHATVGPVTGMPLN